MADNNLKPTFKKPISQVSKNYQKGFDKSMASSGVRNLNEVDGLLSEVEQSLKKKIFSLAKMEALVFSDPKLSAVYEEMAENGEEKYGYHYNETIMNMLFNDYVLNSPKYLQKYKQAQPKEKKRRDKSGINQLKKKGEEMQTRNLEPKKVKPIKTNEAELEETSGTGGAAGGGAFSGSGQYTAPLGYDKKVDETTGSASSGAYVGPAVWGSGDLMKTKGNAKVKTTPMIKGGKIIQESKNYLIEAESFEEFFNSLNEDFGREDSPLKDTNAGKISTGVWDKTAPGKGIAAKSPVGTDTKRAEEIINNGSSEFSSGAVENWSKEDKEIEIDTLKTGQLDKPNLETMEENKKIDEEAQSMIGDSPDTMANKPTPMGTQSGNMDMGARAGGGMSENKLTELFDSRKEFVVTYKNSQGETETTDISGLSKESAIKDFIKSLKNRGLAIKPTDIISVRSGVSEAMDLMEEINEELKAFSIHQDKLKKMTEDRKPSALVLKDRLGNDNVKNFKSDLKDSSVSKLVDIENSLEYADQQTDIGDNPYELGEKIEKTALKAGDMKSGEALKNVGNSANDKGDEIPKRNLSKEEQDEVNLYRLGLGDLVYDNEVGERFENRMKADMGDKLYQQRQDKLAFRGKAPMYNKDPQPVSDTTSDKVQFNKEQTGWNEREGLKESAVSGKYVDVLGKKRIINFNLNEVKTINTVRQSGLFEVSLEGMGNSYAHIEKSSGSQLNINEAAVKAMNENKFYTDGKRVFSLKNPVQKLNENTQGVQKPVINEQLEKMKHLTGFKASTFTDTNSVKKNRGF
jgi:hypothetical protein